MSRAKDAAKLSSSTGLFLLSGDEMTHGDDLPLLKWLFKTKQGFACLVPTIALIASIFFNVMQMIDRNAADPREFESAGSFRDGQLMDSIIAQCRSKPNDSPPPLKIVADLAAYGAFTHPRKFDDYLDAIRRRCDNGRNTVSCIFLTIEKRKEVLRLQFKDFEARKKSKPFLDKMQALVSSTYGLKAIEKLELEAKILKVSEFSIEEWVNLVAEVDNFIISDLNSWGITVKYYPHLLTVHAWSGVRDEAVLAIVDFEGVVEEVGFVTRFEISDKVKKIFEIVEKGSTATDGSDEIP